MNGKILFNKFLTSICQIKSLSSHSFDIEKICTDYGKKPILVYKLNFLYKVLGGLLHKSTSYYQELLAMLKRIIPIILFLSLSGLLYAKEQKTVSLSLSVARSNRTWASNQQNIPSTADDVISVDFRTNYCPVRCLKDE